MNVKKQTITVILANADYAIYEAYLNNGVMDGTDQQISWHIEAQGGTAADTIKDKLDAILPEMGGFDDFDVTCIDAGDGDWDVLIQTYSFTFDYLSITEFSRKLFNVARRYGGEYKFWHIEQ